MEKPVLASIIGTRPQTIKHAVLRKALLPHFNVITIHTGQHYDPSLFHELFADLLLPPPDFSVTREGANSSGEWLDRIVHILQQVKPNAVIVFGDTDSTLLGSQAATKLGIPLVHVEAGERSYNDDMPEEQNRKLSDQLAQILFCVSSRSARQLSKEGISNGVFVVGDLMKDLLIRNLADCQLPSGPDYYLATIHRNYTQRDGKQLSDFLNQLDSLDATVIFPLHPSTKRWLSEHEIDAVVYSNINFVAPVGYNKCLCLQKNARAIITDSGGMQKEAYWLKKPCITLRTETEWTETLEHHWNQLCYNGIEIDALLKNKPGFHNESLYGNGDAAGNITKILLNELQC